MSLNKVNFRIFKAIVTDFKKDNENSNYDACSYTMGQNLVIYRKARKTSIKLGQFVTLYYRNSIGVIKPYDIKDNFDLVIINYVDKQKRGLFIFTKEVLNHHGIISGNLKLGKLSFRVYSPWDKPKSAQAINSQSWQSQYFTSLL